MLLFVVGGGFAVGVCDDGAGRNGHVGSNVVVVVGGGVAVVAVGVVVAVVVVTVVSYTFV